MIKEYAELINFARRTGFDGPKEIYSVRDWLRENHNIHVEVGSIWDESNTKVESYFFSVTAPMTIYYIEPVYHSGPSSYRDMLHYGVYEGLKLLNSYNKQRHIKVNDDELVVAYLKGYSDKENQQRVIPLFPTLIEEYAYLQGKQGNYIEEGLTDDDIVNLVRIDASDVEQIKLIR